MGRGGDQFISFFMVNLTTAWNRFVFQDRLKGLNGLSSAAFQWIFDGGMQYASDLFRVVYWRNFSDQWLKSCENGVYL